MEFFKKLKFAIGVIYRGIVRLPGRLRMPDPDMYETPVLEEGKYKVAVYFADGTENMYQMRQWYGPIQELNKKLPVIVFARNKETSKILSEESGLEISYKPKIVMIEEEVNRQPLDVVLYVNQNTRNFQMMRYGKPAHVFINHGESDKAYMTSNQIRTYNYAFIAGEAAKSRLSKALIDYDVELRTITIGRPQVDFLSGEAPFQEDERLTVFYSPTWEGDRPATAYGSVLSHGIRIASSILGNPKYRFIYRPHPRSGVVDDGYREANHKIIAMIKAANAEDTTANHIYDDSKQITWQLTKTDVMICDISAMLYDRLAIAKPLIVTRPLDSEAEVEEVGYLTACEWLDAEQTIDIISIIEKVSSDKQSMSKLQNWSEFYFGKNQKNSTVPFIKAVEEVIDRMNKMRNIMND